MAEEQVAIETSPLVIKELGGDKRTLRLTGRALPYRNYPLETSQRAEINWLPGSPVATMTVLGATEAPTEINGKWKDKFLGGDTAYAQLDGEQLKTAQKLISVIEDIQLCGQTLQVSFLNTIRLGLITKFRREYETAHDASWSIEFSWLSRGDQPGPAVFITANSLSDTSSAMFSNWKKLDDIKLPSFGLSFNFLNIFQELQHGIENLVFSIQDTVVNFTDQILSPVRAAQGLVATLFGIEQEVQDLIDFVTGQVAGEINPATTLAAQSFSTRLEANAFVNDLKFWAKEIQRVAVEHRTALVDQISGDLVGTYIARDGQDLRDVAKLFYNNPFEWRRLMLFNELTQAELQPGQLILVPKINPAEAEPGDF